MGNPLKTAPAPTERKSAFRALEWARMAEDKNLTRQAAAWRKAHEEGWDDKHYCPLAAERFRETVASKRS